MESNADGAVKVSNYFLPFFSMLAAVSPFAMQVYVPAIPGMVDEFNSDINILNSTISSYMIGTAIGQLFGGPLSDQLGRKTIATGGLIVFILATLCIIFSPNIEVLFMGRIVQALGGGFASVICMASVRDVFPPLEAGRKYALVLIVMMIAPMLAPFIGAFLLNYGWRSIFWAVAAYGMVALTWYRLGIPETNTSATNKVDFLNILEKFNGVFQKKSGNLRPILYSLSITFSTGVVMIILTQSAFMYMEYFGVSAQRFPFILALNSFLIMLAMFYSMQRQKKVHPHYLFKKGSYFQLLVVTVLFLYVYFAEPSLPVIIILVALSQGAMGLCSPNGVAVYISHYNKLAGSATSINLMFLFGVGSILGTIPAFFFDGSLLPVTAVMLVSSLVCVAIGFIIPEPDLTDSELKKA